MPSSMIHQSAPKFAMIICIDWLALTRPFAKPGSDAVDDDQKQLTGSRSLTDSSSFVHSSGVASGFEIEGNKSHFISNGKSYYNDIFLLIHCIFKFLKMRTYVKTDKMNFWTNCKKRYCNYIEKINRSIEGLTHGNTMSAPSRIFL